MLISRADAYRWLVIGLVVGGLGLSVVALMTRDIAWLVPLAGFPAVVLGYVAVDLWRVRRWRATLLAGWCRGELDPILLVNLVRQVPGLPADTLTGLLEQLPQWPFGTVPPSMRGPLCIAQSLVSEWAAWRLAQRAAAWVVVVAAAGLVWLWQVPTPLLGVLGLPLAGWWWHRRCRMNWGVRMNDLLSQAQAESSGAPDQVAALVESLCWEGVPEMRKRDCLALLGSLLSRATER